MRSLITGGTGYIGLRLTQYLLRRGEHVTLLGFPSNDMPPFDHRRVTVIAGDVRYPETVALALQECDRVYHLAGYARNWARDPNTFFDVNVRGTEVVLAAALEAGIRKVVHTSSNVVIGPSHGGPSDESSLRPCDFYTAYERSKFLSEVVVRAYVQRGLDAVIVNPARVFGPGPLNEANSVTKMIYLYLHGRWRANLGNGKAIGNYVYIDDLVRGFVLAMEHGRSGERYILGGENMSFDAFFDTVAEVSGQRRFIAHLPAPIAIAFGTAQQVLARTFGVWPLITPEWVRNFLADWEQSSGKAQRELGYTITPFRSAVRQTIEWLVDEGLVRSHGIPELMRS